MRHHHGFTLIELLLAVALLTLVATAAVSWAVSQRRSGARIEERYEQVQQMLASRQALHEDLVLATITVPRPDEHGRLVFTTLRQLPDAPPGVHEVTWSFDEDLQALVRSSRGASEGHRRLVVDRLSGARFVQAPERGLVLEIQPQGGTPLSVSLRSWR